MSSGHVWLLLKLKVEKNWCENEELLDDYDYYGKIFGPKK
jgi:GTPase Era involved in 16S rRNA processing